MESNDTKLLEAIHNVETNLGGRLTALETKIDDGVNGRFKDNERRIHSLEVNQRWIVLAILGAVVTAVMSKVLA